MGINSPIKRSKFEKFLEYIGCIYISQKGSHIKYDRIDLKRPVIFPADKEVQPHIIRSNLRTLNIKSEEFKQIIKDL